MSTHSAVTLLLVLTCVAMTLCEGKLVGGWSPMAADSDNVQANSLFAAKQINARSNSLAHKKLVNVHSAEAQVVAGIKYRIVFDIGTTTCSKNSAAEEEAANCALNKEAPIERCTAVVWEQSWLDKRELLEFTCERYMPHDEYFSETNQANEKDFKEKAQAKANTV